MTSARSLAASVAALGFASALTAPMPALAAPAPCERAENYAAQSGAALLRIDELEVRKAAERPVAKPGDQEKDEPADSVFSDIDPTTDNPDDSDSLSEGIGMFGTNLLNLADLSHVTVSELDRGGSGGGAMGVPEAASVSDVGVGESRTAMVATTRINAAGYARIADAKGDLSEPVIQQAPPTHDKATTRNTAAGDVGPLTVGKGTIAAHARWDGAMACGKAAGETSRADTELKKVSLGDLVRVPEKLVSRSTTALERSGGETRTVASSAVTANRIDLAGGAIRVRVLRQPTLVACMSTAGGEISYTPAAIEVSGEGITTKRLSTAGDHADVTLRSLEAAPFPGLDTLRKGAPLPLPIIPGLPKISSPHLESAPAGGEGTRVRISLGEVRQARKGRAIAAKATAIQVAITQGGGSDASSASDRDKKGYGSATTLAMTMGFGLMEAAAVAPAADLEGVSAAGGTAGGLPITGPRLDVLAYAGVGLLAVGAGAVLMTIRRRRSRL
ncbi:hypothetical protein HH310_39090 [Actinoplanes sp. TBRC 11911]|uniref:hypothetical protein n=1 Tax=Actinoplanes sp. TBRC 11911 TaxID=2729386 RepID=UPI00145F523B|nr:hypothetical protein [Actinoplanes sp. TBRC 11911]NMO57167.1 hypothetical protein [Actinoplanes sp. TBRC 11911]